jgi:polyhydroxybutyrate depolymerase
MTFRVGAELCTRVAAIAPVSGHCWIGDARLARPVPMIYIIGTADPLNPLKGGLGTSPWSIGPTTKPAVSQTLAHWLNANGTPDKPHEIGQTGPATIMLYAPPAGGAETIFVTIKGQGHEWPGAPRVLPARLTGNNVSGYDATDAIWTFFAAHPRATPAK